MRSLEFFQIMEPRNLPKPYFETSVTFEPFGFFDAVFIVVLRRMNVIILYSIFIYFMFSIMISKIESDYANKYL